MYNIKNDKDIEKILKYHRAKDMVNIMKYFPDLSPIDDLVVILDEEDLLRNARFIEFNLSGHTEEKRFRPWQMVDDKRL